MKNTAIRSQPFQILNLCFNLVISLHFYHSTSSSETAQSSICFSQAIRGSQLVKMVGLVYDIWKVSPMREESPSHCKEGPHWISAPGPPCPTPSPDVAPRAGANQRSRSAGQVPRQHLAANRWDALERSSGPSQTYRLPTFSGGLDSHLWCALAQPIPFKGPLPLKGRILNSLAARVSRWAWGSRNEQRATLTRAFLERLALSQLLIFFLPSSPSRPKLAFPPWLAKIVKGR